MGTYLSGKCVGPGGVTKSYLHKSAKDISTAKCFLTTSAINKKSIVKLTPCSKRH